MSTGPAKRANDARETTSEPKEGTALDCSSGPGDEAVDMNSVGAMASGLGLAVPDVGCFLKGHLRSRPRPLLQVHAPGGPGRGARAGRWRRRGAEMRRAPAGAVRARPRGGVGSGGGGKRTPCVAIEKELIPAASWISVGNSFWRPWKTFISSLRKNAGRFVSRCSSASLHPAAGPLRGHRPVEAPSALHHLVCRVSFDTWRHVIAVLLSSFKGPT